MSNLGSMVTGAPLRSRGALAYGAGAALGAGTGKAGRYSARDPRRADWTQLNTNQVTRNAAHSSVKLWNL